PARARFDGYDRNRNNDRKRNTKKTSLIHPWSVVLPLRGNEMLDSTQRLARIKLRETQRQRDRLHQQYDAIEARVAQATLPLERLRRLHEGLREVTFAQKSLHPDVRELDALYLADELGVVPPELVADRTRLLEREMAQGRLRAEFTYTFGRILSEWTSPATEETLDQGTA